MDRLDRIVGKLALPLVVATLIGVPAGAFAYDHYLNSKVPAGAKVFSIYFNGKTGWTESRFAGYNTFASKPPLRELHVHEGDLVVLRLMSTDDHHGFALPAFGVEPIELVPGQYYEVRFRADRVGRFMMFCDLYCGPAHPEMNAWLVVTP